VEPLPSAPSTSSAAREVRLIALLLAGVIAAGSALQLFIAPGPLALVAAGGIAGAALFVLALALPGRLRVTLSGFRFVSVLLTALAVAAILGTLVLQGKPPGLYAAKYNMQLGGLPLPIGDAIVALRLDDIFHSLWFGGLLALFGAAVAVSAVQRWPVRLRNAGFFTCHAGLLTTLAGTALSATFSVKGQVDLHAGGQTVSQVEALVPGLFDTEGRQVSVQVPLGFDLRLDRFDLVRYGSEYRVGYYEVAEDGRERLRASFDPESGVRHRLPGGAVFRIATITQSAAGGAGAAPEPSAVLQIDADGKSFETPPLAASAAKVVPIPGGRAFLAFERREEDVKTFRSAVTVIQGGASRTGLVSVNEPFTYGGWTFYQSNYRQDDPTYSGLQVVRDPGVPWVFLGFALISAGVIYMFYVESRLKRPRAA
jgi:hypothetical protein